MICCYSQSPDSRSCDLPPQTIWWMQVDVSGLLTKTEVNVVMTGICDKCQNTQSDDQSAPRFCSVCGGLMRALVQSSGSSNASDGQLDQADRANSPASPLARQTLTITNPTAAVANLPDVSSANQSKSPVLAGLLSFLLIGMGQVYLGQVEKGLSMLSVALLLIMKVVLGPLGLVLLIFNVLDAFLLARKIERGQPVRKWQFFFHSK